MNTRYLTNIQHLKCNFCTNWFKVTDTFAALQRYCCNICLKCYNNFQYKIVHPETYQIHTVKLIPTSLTLKDTQSILSEQLDKILDGHQQRRNLPKESRQEFQRLRERQNQLFGQIWENIEPISDKIDELYGQIIEKTVESWKRANEKLKRFSTIFSKAKKQQINKLSNSQYNFKIDTDSILCPSNNQYILSVLNEIVDDTKKLSRNDFTKQLHHILDDFMNKNFKVFRQKNNTNLVTPNIKNLKGLRQKLVDKSMISGKKLSIDSSDAKPKLMPTPSVKRIKSNYANKQNNFNLKNHNSSQKSLKSLSGKAKLESHNKGILKTPRSFLDQEQESVSIRTLQIDMYREQISKIIKDKSNEDYQSFMPVALVKQEGPITKNLGDKQKLQHLVELKMKTVSTDKIIELINQQLNLVNTNHFLKSIQCSESVEIIRFVKVNMGDVDFDNLLNWLKTKPQTHTLVLTNNKITETSLKGLETYIQRNPSSKLKNIYLGNNRIKSWNVKHIIEKFRTLQIRVHV